MWVEGVRDRGRVRLFDRWLPIASLDRAGAVTDRRWGGLFHVGEDHHGDLDLRIPGDLFHLPPAPGWRPVGSLDLGQRRLVVPGHGAARPGEEPDRHRRAQPGQAERRGDGEGVGPRGGQDRDQAERP